MARNGSGTFALLATMAPANTVSNSATVNGIMEDVADGLTDSINKDGTKAFEANQSMGGFKLTSLGNGTATGDAANAGQVQGGLLNWADAGGTADAITGSYTPAVTSVSDGNLFFVRASAANTTTTPTFTPNSGTVTARTIVKHGNQALAAGDIGGDGHELILRYRSSDTKYELLNPKATAATPYTVNGQTEETSVAVGDMLGGYDTSGTAERKFSVQNVMKAINGLTEDTSPDTSADFILTYDTSATDVKKVKPSNLATNTYTLIQTLTGTGVSTQAVTSISSTYRSLYIEIEGIGHDNGTNRIPTIAVSANNGSSYGTAADFGTNSINSSETINISANLYGLQMSNLSTTLGATITYTTSPSDGTFENSGRAVFPATSGTINAIRFGWSGAGNFDAGTIRVYGVK